MKRILYTISLLAFALSMNAQTSTPLTIKECYNLARANYPLVKQQELIAKSKQYSVENASKGYLPQVSINGQATYQSDVTEFPVRVPGIETPSFSKDQYKIYGEVNQTIYDGGTIKHQKESIEASSAIEAQQLEVQLYTVKDRVNQLFFGILMLNEQLAQTEIVKKDIQTGLDKTNASIANGAALKSEGDVLQAELLKTDQRTVELKASRKAYLNMLGLFVNQTLDENVQLVKPAKITVSENIKRPELLMYDNQKKLYDAQDKVINSKNLPKLGLFVQGGYGRPALNFLNDNFDSYYIGGIKLNWSLGGFYTRKREKAILNINRNMLDAQKETFVFDTNYKLKQQSAESSKLEELLKSDGEIIALRDRVKKSALAQLENGVINSNDYLREVNAEDLAKQNQLLHDVQLIMTQYNQQTTSGN
jgi:outer membrane protein TolC